MIRVYCKNQTFLLNAVDGTSMSTKANNFNEIPEKFTDDPTYKMALAAGALEVFETAKQGEALAAGAQGGTPDDASGGASGTSPDTAGAPDDASDKSSGKKNKSATEKADDAK